MSMAALHPPLTAAERDRRRGVCAGLADSWEAFVRGGPLCPPGCVCIRGMILAVGASEVEQDVLAFLAARFPEAAEPELAKLIAGRSLEAAWGGAPFGPWIRSLAEAPLAAAAFDALTDSLSTIFQSLGGAEPIPPARFTCT